MTKENIRDNEVRTLLATHRSVQSQMRLWPELLLALPSGTSSPISRRAEFRLQSVEVQRDRIEVLQEPNEEERHLVVCELLAKADARSGVEGEEDERVGREVFVESVVDEAVWVKLFG